MKIKPYIIPVIILVIGMYSNTLMGEFVNSRDRGGVSFDLLHYFIPFNNIYSYLAEAFMLLAGVVFGFYIIKNKKYEYLPFYILCLGLMQIARAILLPLTPIETPYPGGYNYGFLYNFLPTGGTFPSGHTGFVFILFFLIEEDRMYKMFSLIIGLLTGFFLIVSRGHYTIDVIASIAIAYLIVTAAKKYWNKKIVTTE